MATRPKLNTMKIKKYRCIISEFIFGYFDLPGRAEPNYARIVCFLGHQQNGGVREISCNSCKKIPNG